MNWIEEHRDSINAAVDEVPVCVPHTGELCPSVPAHIPGDVKEAE